MAALSGTRRSRRKSVVKPRKSSHATRVHGKKIKRPRPIAQVDVVEKKELLKEKLQKPDWNDKERESQMPEMPAMEDFDLRAHEKKKTKERRKRIKKNPRKNWKELGLLEKRGLA